MRIKTVQLAWFRGAADSVALDLNCKSMVVYGSNASGKSCFVDAIEYVLNDGRLEHLAHEYSGRKQERAIPNTHTPRGQKSSLSIKFKDDSEHNVEIAKDGSFTDDAAKAPAMSSWEYRRTVLRQHEVADFIQSRKGEKYSALLPLLGLHPLECSAENLRHLARSVEEEADLGATKIRLMGIATKRKDAFESDTEGQILAKIEKRHAKYCPEHAATTDSLARCRELNTAIDARIDASSAEQKRYFALTDAAALDLRGHIDAARTASGKLAGDAESLITERLEVLQFASTYAGKLTDEEEVSCPACGRSISVADFKAHLDTERERLGGIIDSFNTRKAAIGTLCGTVRTLQQTLGKPALKSWREGLAKGSVAKKFEYLDGTDTEILRTSCGEDELKALDTYLSPLIDAATSASREAPPGVQELSTDKKTVGVAIDILDAKKVAVVVQRAERLIDFIGSLEQGVRDEIREQAETVIATISSDIQTMWGILHPSEAIDNVRLYLPDDTDKAIDIGLQFYGVHQDSPRLTLSEGYRNSLGLCIFLAMAKQEATHDRPVFLDDVVVSFDREHRGMIAELLEQEFSERQVIILTHDRVWYTELRHRLPRQRWGFGRLLPWKTPQAGICWSGRGTTFADARAYLKDRPDTAAADARKIMDVELSIIAECVRSKLRYLRGERNDVRMAYEFLARLAADAKKCLKKKDDATYVPVSDAVALLTEAKRLLVALANRAAHTFDITETEATALIDACEAAIQCFQCSACGESICIAHLESEQCVQCGCGELRWVYGKA